MSVEAEWKGKIEEKVNTHCEYHDSHFKNIGDMKIEITKLQIKVAVFSFLGSIIGGTITTFLITTLLRK